MNINNYKKAFTLIEVVLVIAIMSIVLLGSVALVGAKKLRRTVTPFKPHGSFECYYDNEGNLHSWYVDNQNNINGLADQHISNGTCVFEPVFAEFYTLQVIGAGQNSAGFGHTYPNGVAEISPNEPSEETYGYAYLGVSSPINDGGWYDDRYKKGDWVPRLWNIQWRPVEGEPAAPFTVNFYPIAKDGGSGECIITLRTNDPNCEDCDVFPGTDLGDCDFSCYNFTCANGGDTAHLNTYTFNIRPLANEYYESDFDLGSGISTLRLGNKQFQVQTFSGGPGKLEYTNGVISNVKHGENGAEPKIIKHSEGLELVKTTDTGLYFEGAKAPTNIGQYSFYTRQNIDDTGLGTKPIGRPHSRIYLRYYYDDVHPKAEVRYYQNEDIDIDPDDFELLNNADSTNWFGTNPWNKNRLREILKYLDGELDTGLRTYYSEKTFTLSTYYFNQGVPGDFTTIVLPKLDDNARLILRPQAFGSQNCSSIRQELNGNENELISCSNIENTSTEIQVSDINPFGERAISPDELPNYIYTTYSTDLTWRDSFQNLNFYFNSMAEEFQPGKSGSGSYPLLSNLGEDALHARIIRNAIVEKTDYSNTDLNPAGHNCFGQEGVHPVLNDKNQYYCPATQAHHGAVIIVW